MKNLIWAGGLSEEQYGDGSRVINLPGVTVSIRLMLEALNAIGGQEALDLVVEKKDEATERIVKSWPVQFDTSKALKMGFAPDGTLEQTLKDYITDYGIRQGAVE